MARNTRRRETPSQIAAKLAERKRQDFGAVNLSPEASALIRNADIEVTRAGENRADQKVQEDSARRLDGIEQVRQLLKRQECAGCYDALRRLDRDMLVRRGEGDRGPKMERVDEEGATPGWVLKIIQAGDDIDGVQARLSRRDWLLVKELIQPTREYAGWRGLALYVTGEENDHAQAGAFRSACVNLRDAYEDLEQAQAGQRRAA